MPQGALAALAVEDEGGKSGFWYRQAQGPRQTLRPPLAEVPMTPRKAAIRGSTTAVSRCGSVSVLIPVRRWRRPATSI